MNRARSKVDNKSRGIASKTKVLSPGGDYGHSIEAKPRRKVKLMTEKTTVQTLDMVAHHKGLKKKVGENASVALTHLYLKVMTVQDRNMKG